MNDFCENMLSIKVKHKHVYRQRARVTLKNIPFVSKYTAVVTLWPTVGKNWATFISTPGPTVDRPILLPSIEIIKVSDHELNVGHRSDGDVGGEGNSR